MSKDYLNYRWKHIVVTGALVIALTGCASDGDIKEEMPLSATEVEVIVEEVIEEPAIEEVFEEIVEAPVEEVNETEVVEEDNSTEEEDEIEKLKKENKTLKIQKAKLKEKKEAPVSADAEAASRPKSERTCLSRRLWPTGEPMASPRV